MKTHTYLLSALVLTVSSLLLNACSFSFEVLSTPVPTPAVAMIEPPQTSVNDTTELASDDSDRLGLCFSYPQGYTQIPNTDAVEVVAPYLPGAGDTAGRLSLEISDSYNRTVERIADEDMTYAVAQQGVPLENLGRWTVILGGEPAVVLDGMPGQDLQRRVYVVHQQTLYILAFSPTRSENKATVDQMEALFTAVTNSWAWSSCSVADVFTPVPQGLESAPAQTSVNGTVELTSSDSERLGFCFSYPQGYTQIDADAVEIAAPDLPGSNTKGLFWIEIGDAYGRTAEKIADEDMTYAFDQQGLPPENLGRWTVMLGDEQAVVLDGMPGQDFQRRVYVVHEQTLYVLAFMPTRLENQAANEQMEALYNAVTSSWAWSPCSAKE